MHRAAAMQPNGSLVRLSGVILHPRLPTDHPLALDLLLRAAAIALVVVGILGLLPAIVEAAA
jgi:hypothetical protein